MAIYPQTLAGITALLTILDDAGTVVGEDGFRIGGVPIQSGDGETLLGTIVFDDDGHAAFEPEYDYDYLLDEVTC